MDVNDKKADTQSTRSKMSAAQKKAEQHDDEYENVDVHTLENAPGNQLQQVKSALLKGLTIAKDGVVSGATRTRKFIKQQDIKQKYQKSAQWVKDNPKKTLGALASVLVGAGLFARKIVKKRGTQSTSAEETE